jgi:integrase
VPLHPFVYKKLREYIEEHKKGNDDFIFTRRGGQMKSFIYSMANNRLGELVGMSEKDLAENNITFYSGRHYWKTMMSAAGLGEDIEEYFMGHKVSADVKKRYNHLDKRGEAALVEKASEVCGVLDSYVFI